MSLIKYVGTLLLGVITLFSCKNKEKFVTTASGITIEYINHGEGEEVSPGHYLLLNVEYRDENDSVWVNTNSNGRPMVFFKKDSSWTREDVNINEVIYKLVRGDSVTFKMNAAVLFVNTYRVPLPKTIDPTMNLTFQIGVEEVYNNEEFELWKKIKTLEFDRKMYFERIRKDSIEINNIDSYIRNNNLNAKETENGLFYIVENSEEGEYPKNGDIVSVNYTGKILNGDYFDSSIKSKAEEFGFYSPQREPYEPLQFTVGDGTVIKGWDEGIKLLNKGSIATLIIPSKLGYGGRQE